MELDQYLGLFIDESKENLQRLNESLLQLESDPENLEILYDIFRVAHTLKGMSRTMGFNNLADLTHNMENLLDPMRNGTLKANNVILDTLFKCLDGLEKLLIQIVDGQYEDQEHNIITDGLVKTLQGLITGNSNVAEIKTEEKAVTFNEYEKAVINNASAQGFSSKEITIYLNLDCVLKGARAFMVNSALEHFGDIIKTHPEVEALENGEFDESFKLFLITKSNDEEILSTISKISEVNEVKITNTDLTPVIQNTQPETQEKEAVAGIPKIENKVLNQTIRVSADRLNILMDLVGELVIGKTRINQISTDLKVPELSVATEAIGHITTDIQEIVMKLRMIPIDNVFNRFPRLVRDLSKELKKDINLKIVGKDTEIDRIVIDEVGDPLVHLIRNSLDHGLETPEERINNGKPARGTLELQAFNEGDNVVIKVCDDGRGIDPEKVKQSAIKKGLISAQEAKNISTKDILDLIFLPGCSTVKEATDISGRGVGMDVVKSKIAALGGNASVASEVGVGTTITISLPSTMAIVQALLIRIGDEIYAAPLNYISEIIDISRDQLKNVQNKEVFVLRGKTIPILRLHKLLEVPGYQENGNGSYTVVIVKSKGYHFGLVVSELIGQQEIVIKPINRKLCSEDYILGATTLGNGQVVLIINVSSLARNNAKGGQDYD